MLKFHKLRKNSFKKNKSNFMAPNSEILDGDNNDSP
jgi:hypothetical protein